MFYVRPVITSILLLIVSASYSTADSLSQFAKTKRLEHSKNSTTIVIDNTTLRENQNAGSITTCAKPIAEAPQTSDQPDKATLNKRRQHWQKEYRKQVAKIDKARAKLAELETKVADLDAQHFAAGNFGLAEQSLRKRLTAAKAKRDAQAKVLAREEAVLNSIIREARGEGAQPGWFRN